MQLNGVLVLSLIGFIVLEATAYDINGVRATTKFAVLKTSDSDHIKPLASSSRDYTDVLKFSVQRKLLSTSSSDVCKWDSDNNRCVRDLEGVGRLMSSSTDLFVSYLANYFSCFSTKDENSCIAKDQCHWDSTDNGCSFSDFGYGNKDSPCAEAAPRLFAEYEADVICQQQKSSSACQATENCRWNDGVCISDYLKIYFSIDGDDFFAEEENIADAQIDEIIDLYDNEFDLDSSDLDPSTVLEWEVPDLTCPEDATPQICKYSNARVKALVSRVLYCSLSYQSSADCNNDPLCSYVFARRLCSVSTYTRRLTHATGITAIAEDLTNAADRVYLTNLYRCTTVRQQSDCTGGCRWIASIGTCIISTAYYARFISEPITDNTEAESDPVCLLFAGFATSGCEGRSTESRCERSGLCTWTSSGACSTSTVGITVSALGSSDDTDVTFNTVFPDCFASSTEQQCTS